MFHASVDISWTLKAISAFPFWFAIGVFNQSEVTVTDKSRSESKTHCAILKNSVGLSSARAFRHAAHNLDRTAMDLNVGFFSVFVMLLDKEDMSCGII
jgi:hypothetical protein